MEIIYTVTAIVITLPIVSTKFYSKEKQPGCSIMPGDGRSGLAAGETGAGSGWGRCLVYF